MSDAIGRAEAVLRAACGDRVRTSLSMAPLTTFRIGGPAALYLEPESEADLMAVAAALADSSMPVAVLGKGSNVLVSDRGFPGLVLRLGRGFRWASREGEVVTAGGAMPLPALAGVALRHSLAGLEFGVAIPATLGGAVKMNAGAHEGSMSQIVETVEVFRWGSGETTRIGHADAGFSYRRSSLPEDSLVIGAQMRLETGQRSAIRSLMDEARDWRRATQPLAEPNCGSVFKNPPGAHAAELIEQVALKGSRVGDVRVSDKHANFIVADPGAKADDVRALIGHIQDVVQAQTGIELEPEVQMIGAFDDVAT